MKHCMDPQYAWMGTLSVRVRNVLLYNDIDTLEKAKQYTIAEYLTLPNVGSATALEIADWLLKLEK